MTEFPVTETKAATDDLRASFAEFSRGFENYRQENDQKVSALEMRGLSEVKSEEKFASIDAALDDNRRRVDALALNQARPNLGLPQHANETPDMREHKQAFESYVRSGEFSGLKALELKALSAGSGPDGGYLAPPSTEQEVLRRLSLLSPIRGLASVRRTSTGTYKKAFSTTGAAAGWVGETAARPQTNSPTLAELSFPGDGALRHAGGDADNSR